MKFRIPKVRHPYYEDSTTQLWLGSATSLSEIPPESVDCLVTSPPYYLMKTYSDSVPLQWGGDRDCAHSYNDASKCLCGAWLGVLGAEPTPSQYISNLICVFDEMKRILKPGGTVWVNIGDKYAGSGGAHTKTKNPGLSRSLARGGAPISSQPVEGVQRKSLYAIPARFQIAMIDAGWILRADIIWSKTRPAPQNVHDRPTISHEYVLMFTKNGDYYYNYDAVAEDKSPASMERMRYPKHGGNNRAWSEQYAVRSHEYAESELIALKRNLRSVWSIAPKGAPRGFKFYAAYPETLVERCLLAGCPPGGTVIDPFVGSGTTTTVAQKLGLRSIGVDVSREYLDMTVKRIGGEQ